MKSRHKNVIVFHCKCIFAAKMSNYNGVPLLKQYAFVSQWHIKKDLFTALSVNWQLNVTLFTCNILKEIHQVEHKRQASISSG